NVGEPITFYVSVKVPQRYTMQIYRMGWYNGEGGKLYYTKTNIDGDTQPFPYANQVTGLLECDWEEGESWTPPENTVSGFFIVKLTAALSGKQSYIVFVVRDDNRTPSSDFLFQSAVTTYQAYNDYPGNKSYLSDWQKGRSLYKNYSYGPNLPGIPPDGEADDQAREVSFNRPYNPQNRIYDSAGHFFELEYNMVRWLEKDGYDVTYQTDVDTHELPGTLAPGKHKALLVVGHDEYWSWEMRDRVEKARDHPTQPTHLGFFGGNNVHWQIRFKPSTANSAPAGQSNRTIVAYKEHWRDPQPGAGIGDPNYKNNALNINTDNHTITTLWRENKNSLVTGCSTGQLPNCNCPSDTPNCTKYPEDELVGVMTEIAPLIKGDFHFVLELGMPPWIRSGIPNTIRTLNNLVGYEADTYYNNYGRNVQIISSSQIIHPDTQQLGVSNAVYYKLGNQARVFAIGSIRWSWGLDDFGQTNVYTNQPWKSPVRVNSYAQILTRNVINCFAGFTACN
ncbi:MAG TPA: N,N-dimethylformamidase beta subunit family domain-containing protein, partial [Pyrinomonadaceae bacterium]|nr:N,N-dimethylformamidase beta subunit family domain-containing protein [Pyrinomonadaceae bacterium]